MEGSVLLVGEPELEAPWRTLWRPFLADDVDEGAPTVDVRAAPWGYSLRSPGRGVNVTDVWRALVESRNDAVRLGLEATSGVIDLHGAVLVREDQALLLLGDAWAGKTTLALALVERGWRYFSDDLVVIEDDGGLVRPLPKPPGVKAQSWEKMRHHWGPRPPGQLGAPPGPFVTPPPFTGSLSDRARPAWTSFLVFREGAGARMTPLSLGQAVARAGEHLGGVTSSSLSTLVPAFSGAQHALLEYGSTTDAVRRLEELVA